MAFIVSLEAFKPGQRYDETAWTEARIDYSATEDGAYTEVTTVELDPVDSDSTDPQRRDFTFEAASASGWFKVTFLDEDGNEQPAPPVYFPDRGVRPSIADVGLLLRARTKDTAGTEVGIFNDATRPTGTQVEEIIDVGVADVLTRVGSVSDALQPDARNAAALYTAMSVERSYFPEQASQDSSAYELFRQDYLEVVERLVEAAVDAAPGVKGVYSVPLTTSVATPE